MPERSKSARADALLQQIAELRGDTSAAANEVLSFFHQGYPLDNLRQLLRSTQPDVAKLGVWVAAELGSRAQPLLDDIFPLLNSPIPYARLFCD